MLDLAPTDLGVVAPTTPRFAKFGRHHNSKIDGESERWGDGEGGEGGESGRGESRRVACGTLRW
ncbi:hypothetical protein J3R08_004686 [Micromonospora sp. HB375]|nr:hypothetical protein [Micromonospora sp. HB375]